MSFNFFGDLVIRRSESLGLVFFGDTGLLKPTFHYTFKKLRQKSFFKLTIFTLVKSILEPCQPKNGLVLPSSSTPSPGSEISPPWAGSLMPGAQTTSYLRELG